MKLSGEFKIKNDKTILTPYEIFFRITKIFESRMINTEEKEQQFSFRDGIVATLKKTTNGYDITFKNDLKYQNKKELNII